MITLRETRNLKHPSISRSLFAGMMLAALPASANDCIENIAEHLRMTEDAHAKSYGHDLRKGARGKIYGKTTDRAILFFEGHENIPADHDAYFKALKALGYTVIVPLPKGFGMEDAPADGGKMEKAVTANLAKDWLNEALDLYAKTRLCFDEIHLSGFSMGGALSLRVFSALGKEGLGTVKSIALFAPAVSLQKEGTLKMSAAVGKMVKDQVTKKTVKNLASMIQITEVPGSGDHSWRFSNLRGVFKNAKETRGALIGDAEQIPLTVHLSEADGVVNNLGVQNILSRAFPNAKFNVIPASVGVRHDFLGSDKVKQNEIAKECGYTATP